MALVPAIKQTKQTSLDSYSRPSTRLARKEVEAKGTGEAASGPKTRRGWGWTKEALPKLKLKKRADKKPRSLGEHPGLQ